MQELWVQSLGQEDPLEKEMSTHSSILSKNHDVIKMVQIICLLTTFISSIVDDAGQAQWNEVTVNNLNSIM